MIFWSRPIDLSGLVTTAKRGNCGKARSFLRTISECSDEPKKMTEHEVTSELYLIFGKMWVDETADSNLSGQDFENKDAKNYGG